MARWFSSVVLGVCLAFSPAQAGWLSDKLKDAAEKLGERVVDDASDGAYRSGKKRTEKVFEAGRDEGAAPKSSGRSDADPSVTPFPVSASSRPSNSVGEAAPAPVRNDLHFAADLSYVDAETPGRETLGKANVDGERMRWEVVDQEGQRVVSLVDGKAGKMTLLMVDSKTFLEYPLSGAMGQADPRAMLSRGPCDGYRSSVDHGGDEVDGRPATQWTCTDPEDPDSAQTLDVWLDKKLGIPLRSEDNDGNRFEMRNLVEGPQQARLFQVPTDYTRMSMFGGGSAGPEAAHPYAPKVEPVPGSEGSLGAMILANTVVPEASTVGIPCYPRARVFQATNKPMIEGGTNHVLVLLSEDAPERVLAFYRMKLSGWKEEKLMGVGDPVFHRGVGSIDLLSAEGQSTPNVAVETITESMKFDVMPTARTKITLGYQPEP